MSDAIRAWLINLNSYPGWKEWKRKQAMHTLLFYDPVLPPSAKSADDFRFSDEVEKQHAIISRYLELEEVIVRLKECDRGLPVSRHVHFTNICEMYFGRFYEFKARIKEYFEAVEALAPDQRIMSARSSSVLTRC